MAIVGQLNVDLESFNTTAPYSVTLSVGNTGWAWLRSADFLVAFNSGGPGVLNYNLQARGFNTGGPLSGSLFLVLNSVYNSSFTGILLSIPLFGYNSSYHSPMLLPPYTALSLFDPSGESAGCGVTGVFAVDYGS